MLMFRTNFPGLNITVRNFLLFFAINFTLQPIVTAESITANRTAGDNGLSENFSMRLDASAVNETGDKVYKAIVNYFHRAERAIEGEDIEALMSLYSDKYKNLNGQDKLFARKIWQKIFANFDNLSARHSMKLLTYENLDGNKIAVTECNGLLAGTPVGEKQLVTIDSWDRQRHILTKEESWKLFGNAGKGERRYGEEKMDTHPLF